MFLLGAIGIVLLGYIAICGAVIYARIEEIQIDIACLLKCKASNIADQLIKDGYVTTKTGRKKAEV